MSSRILAQRAPVLWLLLPWMLGLTFGKLSPIPLPVPVLLGIGLLGAVVATFVFRRTLVWAGVLMLSAFTTSAACYELVRDRLPEWDRYPPREAKLFVSVERVFAASVDPRKVSGLGRVSAADGHLRSLVGQSIYFSGRLRGHQARPLRSAEIELVGQLEVLPKSPPANSFDGYLAGSGVNFKLARAKIGAERRAANRYWRWCDAMQRSMSEILAFGIQAHPELVGVLRAMLMGQQNELSEAQDAWFTQSGTLHLFSISGLHIGVISMALAGILTVARVPPWGRFILIVALLWLYVDITGRAPSAVRSFLMIALLNAASVLRAPVNTVSTLVVSAFLVLVIDPMQLFSASFQMSYGIVAALLVLGLPLADTWEKRFPVFGDLPPTLWRRWHRVVAWTWRATLSTVAVGLSTTPVSVVTGVLYFGLVTPGSLIANLVMIPAASLALLGGFASVMASLLGEPALSVIFNHAAALVLAFIDRGTAAFVTLPGVFMNAHFIATWIGFGAFAVLMALLLVGFHQAWSRRVGGFWTPFAFTSAVVIFLVTFD